MIATLASIMRIKVVATVCMYSMVYRSVIWASGRMALTKATVFNFKETLIYTWGNSLKTLKMVMGYSLRKIRMGLSQLLKL